MVDIVIFGTGGHAKVVYDIILCQKIYNPVAFVSLNDEMTSFLGIPHYHQNKIQELELHAGVVAIGDNFIRSQVVEGILNQKPNFNFVTAVHPTSCLGRDVVLGAGTVAMANSVLNIGTKIGRHVVVNTSSSVDHDGDIGQFASLAPGCVLGGNVTVGEFSAISLCAQVVHGVKIGSHTVVGAGALVLDDIENFKVAYGSPCRVVRTRVAGEKYL